MNLKYKKLVLFTLLSTMGIGVITLSIAPKNNREGQESINITKENDGNEIAPIKANMGITPTLAIIITSTPEPLPTTLPVYDIETEGYPKITELMKSYYEAKLKCDVDKLKSLLNDTSNVSSKKQLKKDVKFIEEYKNIKCYVKKGYKEGTYIVFVYNEVKFINIKTPAPAADQFYVITDSKGNLKIYSEEFDELTKEYYNNRLQDLDVIEIIDFTNQKGEEAKAKDKNLKSFWDKLDEEAE